MTIIARRTATARHLQRLGAAGWCLIGEAEIIGVFGSGPVARIIWL